MSSRARDRLRQAEHDLEVARTLHAAEKFDWVCFASHQAAAKALKALYQHHHAEGWGHSLARLVEGLLPDEPELTAHRDAARIPD